MRQVLFHLHSQHTSEKVPENLLWPIGFRGRDNIFAVSCKSSSGHGRIQSTWSRHIEPSCHLLNAKSVPVQIRDIWIVFRKWSNTVMKLDVPLISFLFFRSLCPSRVSVTWILSVWKSPMIWARLLCGNVRYSYLESVVESLGNVFGCWDSMLDLVSKSVSVREVIGTGWVSVPRKSSFLNGEGLTLSELFLPWSDLCAVSCDDGKEAQVGIGFCTDRIRVGWV